MSKAKIIAANEKHFESLIQDFKDGGFILVMQSNKFAKLKKCNECVTVVLK